MPRQLEVIGGAERVSAEFIEHQKKLLELMKDLQIREVTMARETIKSLGKNYLDEATRVTGNRSGRGSASITLKNQVIVAEAMLSLKLLGLEQIDAALDAVLNGKYGDCRKCDIPVEEARLKAQPTALCHVKCESDC